MVAVDVFFCRYDRGANLRQNCAVFPADLYLSFLCSLLHSEASLDTQYLTAIHMREVVVPCLCDHVKTAFCNTNQVIEAMEHLFMNVSMIYIIDDMENFYHSFCLSISVSVIFKKNVRYLKYVALSF